MQKWSESDQKFVSVTGYGQNVAVGPGGKPFMVDVSRAVYWPDEACSTATAVA